jgi:hypothetical protein
MAEETTVANRKVRENWMGEGRRRTFQKVGFDRASHCSGKQCLTSTRRTIEQNTFRRLDSHAEEELRVLQWQFNDLPKLSDLVVETTDSGKVHLTRVFQGHVVNHGVDLTR